MKQQLFTKERINLLWDVLTLNSRFYEHSQRHPQLVKIAQIVVFLAAIAHALGSILIPLLAQLSVPLIFLIFLLNALIVILGYYLWTYTICQMGKWLKLPIPSYRELLAPIGFAYFPQILNFLTVIPLLGRPIEITLATWTLLATIVAINQGLNIKLKWTIFICLPIWLLVQIAIGIVQILMNWVIV
ncbi:hypothetical protein [Nodularia chucula]|uniref:hypothetical protein n=1 Tax=Nodularia chucula TaxID=3093667 RepID=UPI0039C614F4